MGLAKVLKSLKRPRLSKASIVFTIVFLIGLGLMLVAIGLHGEVHRSFGVGFLERLGDALMIAAVIGGLLERAVRSEEYMNILARLVGAFLPPELREHIRHYFDVSMVRTNWTIEYTIGKSNKKPGFWELKVESYYEMRNHSKKDKTYTMTYSVEDQSVSGWPATEITKVRAAGKDVVPLSGTHNGYRAATTVVLMNPYDKEDDATSYKFESESTQWFKELIVSPFWTNYPVTALTVTVWYPKPALDVQFDITFDEVNKATTPTLNLNDKGREGSKWEFKTPFLPGQGFLVRCLTKSLPHKGTAAAGPAVP